MRYAIYFQWNDGFEDSFNVESAKERDLNIQDMIRRKDFRDIHYCPIYSTGEYGDFTWKLGSFDEYLTDYGRFKEEMKHEFF